jgi:3-oxoacyl-[acyl-carrier protein] reductase
MTTNAAFSDRTALVTGASSGIGAGIAAAFARSGLSVIAVARRGDRLGDVIAGLAGTPRQRHRAVTADLATDEGLTRAIAAITDSGATVLVNNAGRSIPAPPPSSQQLWSQAFRVQFDAPRQLSEAAMTAMTGAGFGRILMIGGTLEPSSVPNASTAAKAALGIWSKAFANLVAPHGITVNTIIPGRIDSEQLRTTLHPDPAERADFVRRHIPVGYIGDRTDVGALATFLASDAARYVTGAVIPVDGGMRRHAF